MMLSQHADLFEVLKIKIYCFLNHMLFYMIHDMCCSSAQHTIESNNKALLAVELGEGVLELLLE